MTIINGTGSGTGPLGSPSGAATEPGANGDVSEPIRILLLAANPRTTERLAIEDEMRAIERKLKHSQKRDLFKLIVCHAVRPSDLIEYLNEHRPHVVHFSGHGTQAGEIVLSSDDGTDRAVGVEALTEVFRTMRNDDIRVVLLNACYTAKQARAINQYVDFVIGTRAPLTDEAATVYAAAFYSALGFGRTVPVAFEQAQAAMMVNNLPGHDVAELLHRPGADVNLLRGNGRAIRHLGTHHSEPTRPPVKSRRRKVIWATAAAVATACLVLASAYALGWFNGSGVTPVRSGKAAGDSAVFDVYQHYSPRGFIGDVGDIHIEQEPEPRLVRFTYDAAAKGPHECDSKFANGSLNPASCRFAGILFLDGDWGRDLGRGYDLRGRQTVKWEARSTSGPVSVEFFAGGVNWVWDEQSGTKVRTPNSDSMRRETLAHTKLTEAWQAFTWKITSADHDLQAVIGPFGWIVGWDSNGVTAAQPKKFVIEIRGVAYEK